MINTSTKMLSLSGVQNTELLCRGNLWFSSRIARGQQVVGMAADALVTSVAFMVTLSWCWSTENAWTLHASDRMMVEET